MLLPTSMVRSRTARGLRLRLTRGPIGLQSSLSQSLLMNVEIAGMTHLCLGLQQAAVRIGEAGDTATK